MAAASEIVQPPSVSMGAWAAGAAAVTACAALIVASLIRRFRAAGIVDEVGARSSHARPTPRGGGVGFVAAATLGWAATVMFMPGTPTRALAGVALSGVLVAGVGFLDDLRGVPALLRLLVHLVASAVGLWSLGVVLPEGMAGGVALAGSVALVVGVAWLVNAFNFMDGTDAFAATHGLAVAGLVTVLAWPGVSHDTGCMIALGVASAVTGFLPFNWPRARIFMGDVGSGWLGLVIALGLVATHRTTPGVAIAGLAWLSPFLMDPTVCLARRASRGERVWQAHRSHGYQNLVRRLGGHARLLAVWWALMAVVYLPLALLAWRDGGWFWLGVSLAVGVVQALVLRSGVSGVAETRT